MESPTDLFRHIVFTHRYPKSYSYGFDTGIFHQDQHLALQGEKYVSYYVLHQKRKKILAHVHFHLQNHQAFSPARASFGGIECAALLDLQILWKFIDYVEEELRKEKAKQIKIIYPPLFYDPSRLSKLSDLHHKKQYKIASWVTGACIPVNDLPYELALKEDERRRLKKGSAEGFVLKKNPLEDLDQIYHFIANCRKSKDQSISMSFNQLQETVSIFPENFHLFSILKEGNIIAASISIRINHMILYNFYSAHHAEYDKYSPVIMLFNFIYSFCQSHKIKTFDLGTSEIDGMPNFNLFHFKERLGATLTPKLTFTKDLL